MRLMPSNRIQPETPWENLVAFAEEARCLRRESDPPGVAGGLWMVQCAESPYKSSGTANTSVDDSHFPT